MSAIQGRCAQVRGAEQRRVAARRAKHPPWPERSAAGCMVAQPDQAPLAFTSRKTARLVRDWLDWRGPHITYLFCPIYQGKALQRSLSTTSVKSLIKSSAKSAGLDPDEIDGFSGHSLRVGAAQDLLCAGFDTAAIMRAGGWKSVNILSRYLAYAEHNVWR